MRLPTGPVAPTIHQSVALRVSTKYNFKCLRRKSGWSNPPWPAESCFRRWRNGAARARYNLIGLDASTFTNFGGLLQSRNELLWVSGEVDPPNLRFDFYGLWFDAPFTCSDSDRGARPAPGAVWRGPAPDTRVLE